jgi:hypothetical protein
VRRTTICDAVVLSSSGMTELNPGRCEHCNKTFG